MYSRLDQGLKIQPPIGPPSCQERLIQPLAQIHISPSFSYSGSAFKGERETAIPFCPMQSVTECNCAENKSNSSTFGFGLPCGAGVPEAVRRIGLNTRGTKQMWTAPEAPFHVKMLKCIERSHRATRHIQLRAERTPRHRYESNARDNTIPLTLTEKFPTISRLINVYTTPGRTVMYTAAFGDGPARRASSAQTRSLEFGVLVPPFSLHELPINRVIYEYARDSSDNIYMTGVGPQPDRVRDAANKRTTMLMEGNVS